LAGPTGGGVPGTALPVLGGCQIFPADNAWNRDVSGEPVHPNSASLLAAMSPESPIHLDLGTTQEYYGIPYTVVPRDQPLVPISYGTGGMDYSDESDPGPMPIPLDAPIEGGSSNAPDPATGDRHVLVLRQGDCRLFELYNAERTGSGFRVSSSAIWDLTVNATRPPGWPTRRGSPSFPGCSRTTRSRPTGWATPCDSLCRRSGAYVSPASHCGSSTDPRLPPYGTRVRFKAGFPLGNYTGDGRVLLTALKRYGLILADQGSAWYITGTSEPAWTDALDQLRRFPVRGSDFEVLQSGAVITC
jgi:hypothetical protein